MSVYCWERTELIRRTQGMAAIINNGNDRNFHKDFIGYRMNFY